MTEPDLGAPRAPAAGAGPVVRLSLSALLGNISLARDRGAAPVPPTGSALVADAWGHGEAWVGSILDDVGAAEVSLDPVTLYGLGGAADGARPVMSLVGHVLSTKALREGEGVSYGYAHIAAADTRIALVTGGYAQGVVRALGNRAALLLRSVRAPILGRVAMDVCVVEIGENEVARGDEAIFFGDAGSGATPVSAWAAVTGLGVGEIVSAVGARVPRVVVA